MSKIIFAHFKAQDAPITRCSEVLLSQLAHMPMTQGMNYPFQFVLQEIIHLEDNRKSQTKPPERFTRNPALRSFWHKHFCVPQYEHLGWNARAALKSNVVLDGSDEPEKFTQMALTVAKKHTEATTDEELWKFSSDLADEFMKRIEKGRTDGVNTGDWLIYTAYQGKNYYLCIAKHHEDEFIIEALKTCSQELPWIKELL